MNQCAQRESLLGRLKQSNEVTITVTGRKTKKRFSAPVWFVLDKERVMLVPMKGSDNNWFKNLAKDPRIELGMSEIAIPCKATLVRDSNQVEGVLDKFRAKYRSAWSESYYTKRDVYVEVPL
jgi:deazaflavin-dependent oxidoreductase (nitroreductase family)